MQFTLQRVHQDFTCALGNQGGREREKEKRVCQGGGNGGGLKQHYTGDVHVQCMHKISFQVHVVIFLVVIINDWHTVCHTIRVFYLFSSEGLS